jgi:hypothetical protein
MAIVAGPNRPFGTVQADTWPVAHAYPGGDANTRCPRHSALRGSALRRNDREDQRVRGPAFDSEKVPETSLLLEPRAAEDPLRGLVVRLHPSLQAPQIQRVQCPRDDQAESGRRHTPVRAPAGLSSSPIRRRASAAAGPPTSAPWHGCCRPRRWLETRLRRCPRGSTADG